MIPCLSLSKSFPFLLLSLLSLFFLFCAFLHFIISALLFPASPFFSVRPLRPILFFHSFPSTTSTFPKFAHFLQFNPQVLGRREASPPYYQMCSHAFLQPFTARIRFKSQSYALSLLLFLPPHASYYECFFMIYMPLVMLSPFPASSYRSLPSLPTIVSQSLNVLSISS